VAGRKLVDKYRWRLGDTVTLKGTIFPGNWDFVLRGIYQGRDENVDETQFIFHWDYLNEALKKTAPGRADQVGFYMVGVDRPEVSGAVAEDIDRMFKNSMAETLTETEKAFQLGFIAMTGAIVIAIQIVSFVVIFIIMAVVANTMAMTTRERFGEYAVLKTLGFRGRHLAVLILGESLVITLLGCALGIALTYPAAVLIKTKLGTYFPIFNVDISTLYLDLAAAVLVGVIAALIPLSRAIGIRIAEGLRRVA